MIGQVLIFTECHANMHRFFIHTPLWSTSFILREQKMIHQILKVLRAKVWDTFTFFDGKKFVDYEYTLEKISSESLNFALTTKKEKTPQNRKVSLFQALPNKAEKIEYIIQKWVEVGISNFYFFRSRWSQKIFLNASKIQRFEKIAIEAVEQSNQNFVPKIDFQESFDKKILWDEQKIVLHHIRSENSKNLEDISFAKEVSIFVGPEWWWSNEEVSVFENAGCEIVLFSGGVLRCETVSSVLAFYIHHK